MPDQERQPEDLRIPLHVEAVSVSRREVEKANVRIALITGAREQLIDEELTHVRVEIERVPIGRTIEVVPPIGQEGDITIIPVVEEVAQAQGAWPAAARRFPLRLPSRPQRGSSCPALSVLPQTAVWPTRQQPLPPPPQPPAPAGQQARNRLPPRRQSHSTDRRSARRLN